MGSHAKTGKGSVGYVVRVQVVKRETTFFGGFQFSGRDFASIASSKEKPERLPRVRGLLRPGNYTPICFFLSATGGGEGEKVPVFAGGELEEGGESSISTPVGEH